MIQTKRYSCECGKIQKEFIDITRPKQCFKCGTICKERNKRVVSQSSLDCFNKKDEDELSPKRKKVFDALKKLKIANNREIGEYLKLPINQITGRVYELRQGRNPLVIDAGSKVDMVTKEKTQLWKCV